VCDNRGIAMHIPLYPTATWSVVIMCSKQARCSKVLSLSLSSSDTGMGSSSSSRQCAGASPHCSYISWNPKMMQLRTVDKFATQSVQCSNPFPSLTQGDQEASSTSFWQFGRNFKLQTLLMGGGGRGPKKHHPFPFDPDDSVVNEPQLAPGYTNVSFPKLGWILPILEKERSSD
jgi:hypothetical protein